MNKPLKFVALGAAVLASIAGISAPAMATSGLAVSPTTTVQLQSNTSTPLAGLAVTGDPTNTLTVTLSTTAGTLTLNEDTGLTYATGSLPSGTGSITVSGLQADIDNALASVALVSGAETTATVSLTASENSTGATYLPSTKHYYKYVAATNISWAAADAAAKLLSVGGQQGYLATIPSSAVNTLVSTLTGNDINVWFGARAYESNDPTPNAIYATVNGVTYPRVWRWTVGADESPIAGKVLTVCTNGTSVSCSSDGAFANWSAGEPNDCCGVDNSAYSGEWFPVTNWEQSGQWNDLGTTTEAANYVAGYVVEFGGRTNANPALGTDFATPVTTSTVLNARTPVQVAAQLGSAGKFAVLAGAATTIPGANIVGDVGAKAALTVTATTVTDGVVHPSSDDATLAALSDAATAYKNLKALPAKEIAADLGGQTLTAGVYHSVAALAETTPVTFDAQGDPNAIFVIQSDAALNTTASTVMVLKNGAKSSNIFWVTTGAATLGASSTFDGMILSNAAVTIGASSTLNGHAYSITAAVTLGATNTITGGYSSPVNMQ